MCAQIIVQQAKSYPGFIVAAKMYPGYSLAYGNNSQSTLHNLPSGGYALVATPVL